MARWWILKVTPAEPSRTAEFLDVQNAVPGATIVVGPGHPTDKRWDECTTADLAHLGLGAQRHLRDFYENMHKDDYIVVGEGNNWIHCLCQVLDDEVHFRADRPDFPDPYWSQHWRKVMILGRYGRLELSDEQRLGRETLTKCKESVRTMVSRQQAAVRGLTWDEAEDATLEPAHLQEVTVWERVRNQGIAKKRKVEENHICELCSTQKFLMTGEVPYCETHHIVRLGDGGWDSPMNIAVLCADCHSEVHYGVRAKQLVSRLLLRAGRELVRDDYHKRPGSRS